MANFEKIESAFDDNDFNKFKIEVSKLKSIDAKNDNGWTCFLLLAFYSASNHDESNHAFLKFLVENGANVNFLEDGGKSAIGVAAFENNLPLLKFLLDLGANINLRTEDGYAPIHQAIRANDAEDVLEFLLSYDACDKTLTTSSKGLTDVAKGASAKKSLALLKKHGFK